MTTRLAITAPDLRDAVYQLRDSARLFVDTEFHAEQRYIPKLYLIQVHTEGGVTWIFDPLSPGVVEAIAEAMTARPWVLHAAQQDLRILAPLLGGLPDEIVDVQLAHGLVSPEFPAPLGALSQRYLGRPLPKEETLSDWSRRPLSDAQLRYAAEDVALLPAIEAHVSRRLGELQRAEVFHQACQELRKNALFLDDTGDAWMDILGIDHLHPQQAAVAAELAIWREEVAREEDSPPRSVLADSLLKDLSRAQPHHVGALHANRKFPKRLAQRHGAALVERIQRAARRPEWAWPDLIQPFSETAFRHQWLQSVALALALRHHWSANLVLPNWVMRNLAVRGPSEDLALRLGWRRELAWEALCSAKSIDLNGTIFS